MSQSRTQPKTSLPKAQRESITSIIFLLLLGILAAVSVIRAFQFAFFDPLGGIDFHSYWHAGLFLRQGQDPYVAYQFELTPTFPIRYLGGHIQSSLSTHAELAADPANTAPIVVLLSAFSWLRWELAETLWFVINIALAFAAIWLIMDMFDAKSQLRKSDQLAIVLIFFALKGTRAVLGTGQTTLIVFVLMLLCLRLWSRNPVWAGICLGIALSKYSIALPLALYAVYKRQWRVLYTSAVVQLAGILWVSFKGSSSPLGIVQIYYTLLQRHTRLPGIHLAHLFASESSLQTIAPILLTAVVAAILGYYVYSQPKGYEQADAVIFAILCLWVLLVAYHRAYDAVLIMPFVVLFLSSWHKPRMRPYSDKLERFAKSVFAASLAFMIVPYEFIARFSPALNLIVSRVVVLALMALLSLAVWLLFQQTHQYNRQAVQTNGDLRD